MAATRLLLICFAAAIACGLSAPHARAAAWYWDSNGTLAGAGGTPTGAWGASSYWTTSSAGTGTTSLDTTTSADSLYFVASPSASSGESPFTVTVTGNQSANSLNFQSSGTATLSGGTISLWSGGITVSQYAFGVTPQGPVILSSPISLQAAQTWTNNSGNPLSINGNVANRGNSLTVAGLGNTALAGNLSGSGSIIMAALGTCTTTGSSSCGGLSVTAGAMLFAATGSLTTGSSGNLFVGTSGPAAVTVQDNATLNVGGNFDLNYQDTSGGASILTLTGGSLAVFGKSSIGEAAMRTGPPTTSAAFYQSGGTVKFSGAATVGDQGTALSLMDINGGSLAAAGGLTVGNSGNGLVQIQGSGIVSVTGGLNIGQDPTLATAGSMNLSSGTLAVSGNLTLGANGDAMGAFTRSGGAMSVSGSLSIAGASQLNLDGTVANVATKFAGLSHTAGATLVIVPQTGNFASSESVSFTTAPSLTSGTTGILGPWAVLADSGTNSSGDYLTLSGNTLAKASYGSFASSTGTTVVSATSSAALARSTTAYAVNFGGFATTLGSTVDLTLANGGLILNGGAVTGGTLTVPNGILPLVYAGSSTPGTIASAFVSDDGFTKFGAGTLVLTGSNRSLTGWITVSAGNLCIQNSLALGGGGSFSPVTVAAGASLQIQGNTALPSATVTLNGTGAGGAGALQSVQNNNSLSGTINLASNSQVATTAGTLTFNGPVQGNYALTKTGTGTLVLAGGSGAAFPALTVAAGEVAVQNSSGLGYETLGTTVNNGATLQLQGGISIDSVPLTISGVGTTGNGALENAPGGSNTFAGPVTLAADSQVNVDSAADTLTLSGNVGGGFALTKGGPGTLLLSGSNSFTQGLNVLSGTLSVPSLNNAGTLGSLGQGTAPVVLGGNGSSAALLYTGSETTTNRAFTLGAGTVAGSGGVFQVTTSLGLYGPIGGNGGLTVAGSGILTLDATNLYTGVTTVGGGSLVIGPSGAINSTSGIIVNQGAALQVTAGTNGGSQLPAAGNLTLGGGTFNYTANGSARAGQSLGALLLNPGQSEVVLTNSGTGSPYLQFAAGTSHSPGATVGFSTTGAQVQFLADPPVMTNGILPYAFVGPANSTTVDFATLSTSSTSPAILSALVYSSSTAGNISAMGSNNGSLNLAATGAQGSITFADACNSLKLASAGSLAMTGTGSLTLISGGLICTGSACSISGGTISAPSGELIVNTATNLSVSSVISASAALTKTGTAALTLTNSKPIAGETFINQGTLVYAPTASLTYSQAIDGPGNVQMSGTGAMLTLAGIDAYTGSTSVTGGTLCVNGSLAGGGPVTAATGAVLTGTGSIAGSVSVNAGVLTLGPQGSGNSLSVGGGVSVGGSGSLAAAGTGAAISGSLNYTSSASSTFSGTILGAASTVTLSSSSGAALTLSGSNQYGGGTFLQHGVLKPTNPAALGDGDLTMSGGTLDLNGLPSFSVALAGFSGGAITKSRTGAVALTVSTPGGIYLSGVNNGSGLVSLVLASSNDGVFILSGSDTYTGGTSVYGGALVIEQTSGLPSGTSLIVGAAASSDLDSFALPIVSPDSLRDGQASASPRPYSGEGQGVRAVPEPGTLILLLAAALWSAAIYRRFGDRR